MSPLMPSVRPEQLRKEAGFVSWLRRDGRARSGAETRRRPGRRHGEDPMARADNHQLTNLSVVQKLLRTFGLLVGLFLFFSASFFGVLFTNWQFSVGDAIGWGGMLRTLHGVSRPWFYGL